MVFDASVVEHVRANLAAPFDLLLARLDLGLCLAAFLEFKFVELRTQVPQCILAVLGLVARLGVLNHNLVGLSGERVGELIVQAHA